tara:strand:- start:1693 stop:3000 length:1308 start_codon:yes stop_codon:yes gene_type:complete
MAISVGGLASGIDTKSLIQQLIQVERAPQLAVKRRQADALRAASAIGELSTLLTTMQTKAGEIDTTEEVSELTAKSSDETVVSASVLGTAGPGIFGVKVIQLAAAQKDRANMGDSLSNAVRAGSYTIDVEGEDSLTFELDPADATVSGLVSAINSANANVVATTIFDGSDYHLSITAKDSGKRVTYSDGFDELDFTTTNSQKAEIELDGLSITHDDNAIEDAIQGVTLNLNSLSELENGKPVATTIEVEEDVDATVANVRGLVDAMNAALSKAKTYSKSSRDGAAILAFDSSVRMMRGRMSQDLITEVTGGSGDINTFSLIGIGMDRYGNVTLNETEFKEALADDYEGTLSLISNSTDGLAKRMRDLADDFNLSDGIFTQRKKMYNNRSDDLGERVERMEVRVLAVEARLKRQFASMERLLSGLQQQQGALARMG